MRNPLRTSQKIFKTFYGKSSFIVIKFLQVELNFTTNLIKKIRERRSASCRLTD